MSQYWDPATGAWKVDSKNFDSKLTSVATAARTAETSATKFKLIIPRHVMDKISWWMHRTTKEVSGFGSLAFDEETNTFTVKDAILLKQKVTSASAEIDPGAMAKAMFRMKDDPNGLKWHWHSHVNMGVFWSADDMEIIRSLGQRSWVLATVFNYRDERKTAYLTQVPVASPLGGTRPHDIFVDDIDTQVINYVPAATYNAWDAEYDEHVTEMSYAYNYSEKTLTPYQRRLELEKEEVKLLNERTEKPDTKFPGRPYTSGTYDSHGYVDAPGFRDGTIYNPCFDTMLVTQSDKLDAIAEMTPDEIDFLVECSPTFKELLRQYNVREARVSSTNDSPAILPNGTGYPDPYENYACE